MINDSFDRRNSLDDNICYQDLLNFNNYNDSSSNRYCLMSKPFRVVDVYDVAAEIGKDFERIIDQFGSEAVQGLMPKVIGVLEELEEYAQKSETESKEMINLQATIQKLEMEVVARTQERSRHEKELEKIEDAWQLETKDLMLMIERLQEDNKTLQEELNSITDKNDKIESYKIKDVKRCSVEESHDMSKIANEDIQLMIRLKEMVDRQTQEIRELKRELAQKCLDLDAMQQQSERLAKLNAELRRKHCVSKKQSDQLLEEKSQLKLELVEKEFEINQMRGRVVHYIDESSNIKTQAQKSLSVEEDEGPQGKRPGNQEFAESLARLSEAQLIEQINTDDKMIFGSNQPSTVSQGKFSLAQLKSVLIERNELKSKLIEVEEELAVYKNAGDDEPPVQGPVNKEPDEKLCPDSKQESGIQRFFQSLLERINGPLN